MRRNHRIDQFDPVSLEPLEGARLVQLHQAAVPDDVSGQYGGELALHERGPFDCLLAFVDNLRQLLEALANAFPPFADVASPSTGKWIGSPVPMSVQPR